MTAISRSLRKRILGISPEEASFSRRGFWHRDDDRRQHLEQVGRTFLQGYERALQERSCSTLESRLLEIDLELRGFAFEGAAMALALLDGMTPWKGQRAESFLAEAAAQRHVYMVHVGLGWALARLPWSIDRTIKAYDPLLRWLAIDGYGFHEGYFRWRNFILNQDRPRRLAGYALRAFDQGLGRSLWFVNGADIGRISETISAFEERRQPDLWSGIGLASAYAGGAGEDELRILRRDASASQDHVAQGVCFAAKTRERAGNLTAETELACRVLCDLTATEVAKLTDLALKDLPPDEDIPAYEIWRERIRGLWVRRDVEHEEPVRHFEASSTADSCSVA
jgi:hypothetical protein